MNAEKRYENQVKKRYVMIAGVRSEILKRMWRKCRNPRFNEWNGKPEYIAVPYEILEEKEKSYVCIRAGWHQKNVLAKREFFESKELCEAEIRTAGMNRVKRKAAPLWNDS